MIKKSGVLMDAKLEYTCECCGCEYEVTNFKTEKFMEVRCVPDAKRIEVRTRCPECGVISWPIVIKKQ